MGKITPSADPTPRRKGIFLRNIPVGSLFKIHPDNNCNAGIYNCIPVSVYIKTDDIAHYMTSIVDIYTGQRYTVDNNLLTIPSSGEIKIIED
jgi:hypothetical protein